MATPNHGSAAEAIDVNKLQGKFFFVGYWEESENDDVKDLLKSIHYYREIYVVPVNGKQRRVLVQDYYNVWHLTWYANMKTLGLLLNSDKHIPNGMVDFNLPDWTGGVILPSHAKKSLPEDFPTPYYDPKYRTLPDGTTEIIPGSRQYNTRITFSPDGTKVAGISKSHICIADVKGTQPAKCVVSQEACDVRPPIWSPDGKRIVFVGPTADNRSACNLHELFIADADGQNVRQLTDVPGIQYPKEEMNVIKPGVKIAYMHKSNSPAWSPDGQWIAFKSLRGLAKIHPDGTGFQVIAKNAAYPTWSPDGKMIAYAAARGDTPENFRYGIFVSWADGTGETWITKDLEMVRGNAQFIYEDLNWAE